MPKLLIVEDDVELSQKVKDWLEFEKFVVDLAHTGVDARQFLDTYAYDAAILDWDLPDTTGVLLCREMRARGMMIPILILTGKSSIDDKEEGFNSGADDYLTKPFHPKELTSRIRALLRRAPVIQNSTYKCGTLTLEVGTYRVTNNGAELQLLPKEYSLLEFLMRNMGQVFSSQALLDGVWESDTNASSDTIRTYIKTLRRKVTNADGECPIKTIHGLGYKIEPLPQK